MPSQTQHPYTFSQRIIGVIVGSGPIAALDYHEMILREVARRRPIPSATWVFSHCFTGTVSSAEFIDPSPLVERRVDMASDALAGRGLAEVLMGASPLGSHCERITKRLGVPVCDQCAVTAQALRDLNLFPTGVLGAGSRVECDFWAHGMRARGGEAIWPSTTERMQMAELLNAGCPIDIARAEFLRVAESLRRAGARSIVLCAPELKRILREEDSMLPLTCAAEQQIRAAVDRACDASEAEVRAILSP